MIVLNELVDGCCPAGSGVYRMQSYGRRLAHFPFTHDVLQGAARPPYYTHDFEFKVTKPELHLTLGIERTRSMTLNSGVVH